MNFKKTYIDDLIVITPNIFGDHRGWFSETYNEQVFMNHGINIKFIQDNHSMSSQIGTLRGLHLQKGEFAQTKLVRCIKGRIFDVAVDLRKSSKTYLKWFGIELSEDNHNQLLIPKGFAHGFMTLTEHAEVIYKVDELYNKESDCSIKYNDSIFDIKWPNIGPILSDKDLNAKTYTESGVDFE